MSVISQPAISLTMVLRIDMPNEPGAFGVLANAIGDAGGAIGAVLGFISGVIEYLTK